MRALLLAGLWLLPLAQVPAASEADVQVRRDRDRYRVIVHARIDAPPARVMSQLQDFDNLDRLHSSVVESRALSRQDTQARVHVRMQGCILFFCRIVTQTLDFQYDTQGRYMVAIMDPAESDYKYGRMRWELQLDAKDTTRLRYQADVVPDFWVPPLIGPWVIKRRLGSVALEMTEALGQPTPTL
ncbi:MAG: SRPBCC family protein [Gammaproteobacteria bacterium]|nr:SRPBCC family protein [Gammaproteobacteria bacterium]